MSWQKDWWKRKRCQMMISGSWLFSLRRFAPFDSAFQTFLGKKQLKKRRKKRFWTIWSLPARKRLKIALILTSKSIGVLRRRNRWWITWKIWGCKVCEGASCTCCLAGLACSIINSTKSGTVLCSCLRLEDGFCCPERVVQFVLRRTTSITSKAVIWGVLCRWKGKRRRQFGCVRVALVRNVCWCGTGGAGESSGDEASGGRALFYVCQSLVYVARSNAVEQGACSLLSHVCDIGGIWFEWCGITPQ